jgi:hypothetical protein
MNHALPREATEEHGLHGVEGHPMPNQALHLTAYSVRSCLAPASGSR